MIFKIIYKAGDYFFAGVWGMSMIEVFLLVIPDVESIFESITSVGMKITAFLTAIAGLIYFIKQKAHKDRMNDEELKTKQLKNKLLEEDVEQKSIETEDLIEKKS